jgi:hypothetical protein
MDMHDGRKRKKHRIKEDAEDISRIVNEAIYGKAVKDPVIVAPVINTPAIAAKPVDDDEESILLLML